MNISKMQLSPLVLILIGFLVFYSVNGEDDVKEASDKDDTEEFDVKYLTPKPKSSVYGFESFDFPASFNKNWIKSQAKKDDVDDNIAKYDGVWELEQASKDPLVGDLGLVLKSKAKHAAISYKLNKPFHFSGKPFIAQYEVHLQNGQECGGAYLKLLSNPVGDLDLKNFNDKTPYTIMFGPDKCGNEHKLHFIFRHVNPLTKAIEEKHCKRPKDKLETPFNDKRPHLYTLIIRPDNTFEILLDHEIINSGHLLEDFVPPVNPPKEIDDPNDNKPSDWDEREKIPDPTASKPEDWDEDAPRKIVDEYATMPDGWLENEPDYVPDPEAVKPEDWDEEMDGEWEPPQVPNAKCKDAPGCGKWTQPSIDNPNYKGKWNAPMINNPNYKGKWFPKKVSNPDYFEDLQPFKMTPISAVGLELWSMSDAIYFDNILITDDVEEARRIAAESFDLKALKIDKGQESIVKKVVRFTNDHPWIYAVYVLALAIPIIVIALCCCGGSEDKVTDPTAAKKKTDDVTADDPQSKEGDDLVAGEAENSSSSEIEEEEAEDKEEDEEDVASKSESEYEKSDSGIRTSPRLRKVRKE